MYCGFSRGEDRGIYALFLVREPAGTYILILEQCSQLLPSAHLSAALYRCGENIKF